MVFVVVPDATIVLCHGFLGFKQVGGIKYFRGVEEKLTNFGCKVITPEVDRTGSIEERAKELNEEITKLLKVAPGTNVNVHLMCKSFLVWFEYGQLTCCSRSQHGRSRCPTTRLSR